MWCCWPKSTGRTSGLSGPATLRILQREYPRIWAEEVRTPGRDFGIALVQPAKQCGVSQGGGSVRTDATDGGVDRGTAPAGTARTAWISACGHGAPGRLGGGERGLPHQRCRYRHAMASDRMHQQNQRAVSDPSIGSDVAPVSLPHPRLPFRQRIGVHQSQGSRVAGKTADRVHQIAVQSQPGQCPGGREKRRGDSQVHRLWATYPSSMPSRCRSSTRRT